MFVLLYMWKCHPALQHWALKLLRVILCLLRWYSRTSRSSCLATERINHFRIDLSKMDDVLKHPILKWHKILLGLLMRMFFLFFKSKNTISMKFIRPKPISKTNKLIPKSYVVVKSSIAQLVPFSNVRTLSVAKFKLSLCTMWHCGQETARNWRALSGKRKFLCSEAKLKRLWRLQEAT